MHTTESSGWQFIDKQGSFELLNPQNNTCLYLPLLNQAGMMSCVTPLLNGDAKTGNNTFLLMPVSVEDLHNSRSARNFWVKINGEVWSVTGNSAEQIWNPKNKRDEQVTLQAGFMWHTVNRSHPDSGLSASVTNFVPEGYDTVELMRVTLTNHGRKVLELLPAAAIPIYGRSADNLRDHRHVTSLLHRTHCHKYGVVVKPTMLFDECGHATNLTIYTVLGVEGTGIPPVGFSPLIDEFIGKGGSLEWPETIIADSPLLQTAGNAFEGYESMGGLHFSQVHLNPGESRTYILILGILSNHQEIEALIERYGSTEKFEAQLRKTKTIWEGKLSLLRFDHGNARFNGWLQWVTLQPTLRWIMGNSFLPYHDYGQGGRGWRDLWQDLIALMITEGKKGGQLLIDNFAGVRMDGSNANIVGNSPGVFIADRNNIPRVWMDHGAWPLLTTKLYLDLTGDLRLLLEKQTYFKDHLTHRSQQLDNQWKPEHGTTLRSTTSEVVQGTILEHLLVQNLTVFYNVGEHNIIRLEGGDWNDGFDMASDRGESVAFSAMYAGNLRTLSQLCLALVESGVEEVAITEELLPLLDSFSVEVDYQSVEAKQARLQDYLDRVAIPLSGKKILISLTKLSSDLRGKADWLSEHIRDREWITDKQGLGWFNGYYDNHGNRVEGESPEGARMTLTGQVFPLMANIATESQSKEIVIAADRHLFDAGLGGYRLNTDFKQTLPELGRAFWFAYGHKENGSVFSHMSVMFAYALYRSGLVQEAWRILNGLYMQSQNFTKCGIYPGLPEYFDPRGRGMYPYLTGSAAWYIFTLLTESYGIKGGLGDLIFEPKLVKTQFDNSDHLKVQTRFADKILQIDYHNSNHLTYGEYFIKAVTINGVKKPLPSGTTFLRFSRKIVLSWSEPVQIDITLA